MIDRLTNIVPGESAVGIKNVTINEPHFQGHFPAQPIMPGVLIVEALAQTAGALVAHSIGARDQGKTVYFMAIDDARFRKPVVPGDTVHLVVEKKQVRGAVWKFSGIAKVGDTVVAESTFTAMIGDP
jgi:3-hydroxyacyl-[acyl-carrier-protein] dehydratase